MSENKKIQPKEANDKKDKKKKVNELDKELDQTFPASDPPSHSRPGHNRKREDKE